MTDHNKGVRAIIGSSFAVLPGAFIFGFPGVMAPYWKETFQVGQGALGNIMFFVGRWQEKLGIKPEFSTRVRFSGVRC